jgi:GTP cyclohydrolase II
VADRLSEARDEARYGILGGGHGTTTRTYRLSLVLSGAASAEAVQFVASGSGGSIHRLAHPLQRIQRDVNVLLNHPTLSIDPVLEQAGRGLLGLGFTIPAF